MSDENVEVVERAFAALAAGGVDGILPHVHERFGMVTPPGLAAEPDTYSGHQGVRRWFDTFYEAMDEVRIEPSALEAVGERVMVEFRMVARGRTTGLEAVQQAVALATVTESKVSGLEFFATREEALAAAAGRA
jgi:ketosteroid isomerase-like protein